MLLDLPISVKFLILSFSLHYIKFYCVYVHSVLRVSRYPYFPAVDSLELTVLFFIERCHCSLYLLLLRRASLFRHGGVCSLQSVPEAHSEAASYRTEKGNTRTGQGCWLWPDGRKRTDLRLSGNVQPHAGTAERMRVSSPYDIRVIKINITIFYCFCIFQQLCIIQNQRKCGFQSPQENTMLCTPISRTLSATVYCVHSFPLVSM